MTDKAKVAAGLAVFLALVAFPLWYSLGATGDASRPELELPANETSCVESTAYMTANHMDLLNSWRNAVVRDGEKEYVATSGRVFVMSLTKTCLDCHTNPENFCTRCHDYSDVTPKCWDCHVGAEGSGT